jgi:hypothetical protein
VTAAEKDRLDRLHRMPCVACGSLPVEAHHMMNQQHKTRDHMRTIPLCGDWTQKWGCHRGPLSIHRSRKSFRAKYGSEEDMLLRVNAMLNEGR